MASMRPAWAAVLDVSFRQIYHNNQPMREPLKPIEYTNLNGFMFLNYLVLACIIAIPVIVVFSFIK